MSELPGTFHTLNPGSQITAQQSAVRRFMREPPDGSQPLIDRCCRQSAGFKVYAVADHHDAVQCQAWLGAVPSNELFNRICIRPPRFGRSQGAEHCGLGMIQIGEPEDCAVQLGFALFWDHAGGLLCRSTKLTHDLRLGSERISYVLAISQQLSWTPGCRRRTALPRARGNAAPLTLEFPQKIAVTSPAYTRSARCRRGRSRSSGHCRPS